MLSQGAYEKRLLFGTRAGNVQMCTCATRLLETVNDSLVRLDEAQQVSDLLIHSL